VCEKKGDKRRRTKKGRRGGAQARLLVGLLPCSVPLYLYMCCGNAPPHLPPSRAITMAITHPPFASFSRAAPHSPPTSLGAAASALRLSPCLSVFLFRGATFLKFQLAFLFSSALIRTGGTGARGSPETPGRWARWARPGPAARWSAPPPQSSLGRSRRTGVLVAVLVSPALKIISCVSACGVSRHTSTSMS